MAKSDGLGDLGLAPIFPLLVPVVGAVLVAWFGFRAAMEGRRATSLLTRANNPYPEDALPPQELPSWLLPAAAVGVVFLATRK